MAADGEATPPLALAVSEARAAEKNDTNVLRPVRLLRVWYSKGLTQADS